MREIKNNPQVYTTQKGKEEIKTNPQVYTTQKGKKEIKNDPQVYTTQEGKEEIKSNPLGIHYPRGKLSNGYDLPYDSQTSNRQLLRVIFFFTEIRACHILEKKDDFNNVNKPPYTHKK